MTPARAYCRHRASLGRLPSTHDQLSSFRDLRHTPQDTPTSRPHCRVVLLERMFAHKNTELPTR